MRFVLQDQEFAIDFDYVGDWTVASIHAVGPYENGKPALLPIAIGASKRHPNDRNRKRIGRKLALRYALADGEFYRAEREEIWNQLFDAGFRAE